MSQPSRGLTLIIAGAGIVLSVVAFLFTQAADQQALNGILLNFAQTHANGIARVFAGHERLLRDVAAGRAILPERGSGLRAIEWSATPPGSGALMPGRRIAGYEPEGVVTLMVALATARDNGRAAVSGLVGAGEVVLVLPTYAAVLPHDAPAEDRRINLSGYATAAVSLGEAVSNSGGAVRGLTFSVADEEAISDQRMLTGTAVAADAAAAAAPLNIAGRAWTVYAVAGPDFAGGRALAPWVLVCGLLATALLAGIVNRQLTRRPAPPMVGEDAVLSSLSHDFRERLNTVIGFSEMMQQQIFGPLGAAQYADYARDINDAGRVVLNKFNDLIDYSALCSGQARCAQDEVSLTATLHDVAALMQPMANIRHNRLTVWVDAELGPIVTDERKLRQILFNLGSAANKSVTSGEIILSASREGEKVAITVSDNGPGLTRQQAAKLFDFSPRDLRDARSEKGVGLDLVIVRLLAELLGGKLVVDSNLGAGTSVSILLPAPTEAALLANGTPAEMAKA